LIRQIGFNETPGREFYRQITSESAPSLDCVVGQAFIVPMGVISANDPIVAEGPPVEPGKAAADVMYNPVSPTFSTPCASIAERSHVTDADNKEAPQVAVINQAMRRILAQENALGKRFRAKGPKGPFIEW